MVTLLICNRMKIIKHTFYISNLKVEDGEIVECEPTEYTYNFSMTLKGMDLFEKEYGQSLLGVMGGLLETIKTGQKKDANKKDGAFNLNDVPIPMLMASIMNGDIIRAIAAASYIKIEGNELFNDEITVEEFKQLPIYNKVTSDVTFVIELLEMAMEDLTDKEQQKKKKQVNSSKKK